MIDLSYLFYKLIATKLPSSQLKRFGFFFNYLRVRSLILSGYKFGQNVRLEKQVLISKNVRIGNNSVVGIGNKIYGEVEIGDNVMIAPEVTILTKNHKTDRTDIPMIFQGEKEYKKVIIENDVWIGMRAIILPGVTIGEGAIIGAGAVVAKSIEKYSVAVGNPAKVVKNRIDRGGYDD